MVTSDYGTVNTNIITVQFDNHMCVLCMKPRLQPVRVQIHQYTTQLTLIIHRYTLHAFMHLDLTFACMYTRLSGRQLSCDDTALELEADTGGGSDLLLNLLHTAGRVTSLTLLIKRLNCPCWSIGHILLENRQPLGML